MDVIFMYHRRPRPFHFAVDSSAEMKPELHVQPALEWERPPQSEVTAVRLLLRERASGAGAGAAVIAPAASYASVLWRGTQRLDRLHVPAAGWKAIAGETAALKPGQEVGRALVLAQLVAGDQAMTITCERLETVSAPQPQLVAALDALVRAPDSGGITFL